MSISNSHLQCIRDHQRVNIAAFVLCPLFRYYDLEGLLFVVLEDIATAFVRFKGRSSRLMLF